MILPSSTDYVYQKTVCLIYNSNVLAYLTRIRGNNMHKCTVVPYNGFSVNIFCTSIQIQSRCNLKYESWLLLLMFIVLLLLSHVVSWVRCGT